MTRSPIYVGLRASIFEGDIVTHSSSGSKLYKVTRVKQVKLLMKDETGKVLEARIEHCKKATNPWDWKEPIAPADEAVTTRFYPGMAVRFKNQHGGRAGVFVLTQKTAAGWFLSRLGGKDKDVRWHKVQEASIVPVPEINEVDWK